MYIDKSIYTYSLDYYLQNTSKQKSPKLVKLFSYYAKNISAGTVYIGQWDFGYSLAFKWFSDFSTGFRFSKKSGYYSDRNSLFLMKFVCSFSRYVTIQMHEVQKCPSLKQDLTSLWVYLGGWLALAGWPENGWNGMTSCLPTKLERQTEWYL